MTGDADRLLLCRVQGQSFALEVMAVAEVVESPPTYPIPRAPAAFLGIMTCHGIPVPVADLAALLGSRPAAGAGGTVVVLEPGRAQLALRVDAVEQIISREEVLGENPGEGEWAAATLLLQGGAARLLAVDRLVTDLELLLGRC
jgi:purine-binding chemotaxis protein CheW